MHEPEKGPGRLPFLHKGKSLADPTCEEGGGAKLREAAGANAGRATFCENELADFCTTEILDTENTIVTTKNKNFQVLPFLLPLTASPVFSVSLLLVPSSTSQGTA
jgi:hypothetical protein